MSGEALRRPGTFDLLGFTHVWGRSRTGKWVVRRGAAKDRFRRALRQVKDGCRQHPNDDLRTQHQALTRKLRGHYGYHGITGNLRALGRFQHEATHAWRRWLSRRSRRARATWARMYALRERYPLPPPRIARPFSPRAANP